MIGNDAINHKICNEKNFNKLNDTFIDLQNISISLETSSLDLCNFFFYFGENLKKFTKNSKDENNSLKLNYQVQNLENYVVSFFDSIKCISHSIMNIFNSNNQVLNKNIIGY